MTTAVTPRKLSETTKPVVAPIDMFVISTACHTAINRNVYKLFVEAGLSVVLVVPRELKFSSGPIKADEPSEDDPPIIYMDLLGGNSRVWRFAGVAEVFSKYRPKLILLDNDPVSFMALKMGIWARNNNAKLFCISCENMPLDLLSSFRKRGLRGIPPALFKRLLLKITKRCVNGVFTVNNEGTDIFKKEGFLNVMKIPLGFDPEYFRIDPQARRVKRQNLSLEGFVISFFGRITFEKGVHILVSALEKLKDYKWTLVIDEFDIYKSKYGQEIHRQVTDAGLSDRIVSINPKHSEMGEYVNSVDVVVMPSISTTMWIEQYGRIAAEAMACGKVVVASDSGALPMLLNNHGILFPEGDVDALVEILRKFIVAGSTEEYDYTPEEISRYAHSTLSTTRQLKEMSDFFDRV